MPLITITLRSQQHNGIDDGSKDSERERKRWIFFFFLKGNKNSTIICFLKRGHLARPSVAGGSLRTQQLKEGFRNPLASAPFRF